MRRSMGVALATAALGGSVLTGCGGGGKPLSKAEYLKQGNVICAKGSKKIETAAKKAFGGAKSQPNKKDITKFAEDEAIPAVESQLSDLRDLEPPKADKDKVGSFLDKADAALKKVKDDPTLLGQGNPFEEANQLAGDYGLTECAK